MLSLSTSSKYNYWNGNPIIWLIFRSSYYPQTRVMSRLLTPLSEQVSTISDLNKFRSFANDSRHFLKGIRQAMQQSLETMLTNVQWMDWNYHKFSRTIRHHL